MSDNDRNDERPTEPAEPTSGPGHQGGVADANDAARGWRPSADEPRSDATDAPSAGVPAEQPPAATGDAASTPGAGSAGPTGPHAGQPADQTTTPQPYSGATWPPPAYGQQQYGTAPTSGAAAPSYGATPMPGATPTSGASQTSDAGPTSGAASGSPGGWQPAAQPGGYQPGGYHPGSYPVGGYPTAQYQQPGYQPGAQPTTGGGYPGDPTTGAGYSGPYQQSSPNPGGSRRGRTGTKVAAGVLGVLLAVGGGVAGAAWMHELDGNNTTTTASVGAGGAPDTAPIIDRSSLASIAAAVRPSVVSITTANATGSGVIISADGYILTNNHVAATANGSNVDITLSDGTNLKGKLIGTDPKTDLAVFQAQNPTKKLTPAKFGNSNALRVGDTVLAIGSPLGLDGSVTSGIVSALNRTIDESSDSQPQDPFGQQGQQSQNATPGATIAGAIQTDAAINPGNSGGALVNTNGEVVGINTAIATNGSDGNIGVGFAIPSNRANTVSQDIIKGVAVQHPFLGIGVVTANGNGGAQVQQVTSGSPAASAGLKVNDVITAYNGQPVHTSDDLINDVQGGNVNDQVTLTVQRSGSSQQIKVTLGESK
ncbi:MAG TPA: trypsin-like peptidase domain-containing protein [Micromonosporaceae bacterium]|nr:trypsin-like peptidase domain-containing protein [Micromonosporaceae bacterium]